MGMAASSPEDKVLNQISVPNRILALSKKIAVDNERKGALSKVKDRAAQGLASQFSNDKIKRSLGVGGGKRRKIKSKKRTKRRKQKPKRRKNHTKNNHTKKNHTKKTRTKKNRNKKNRTKKNRNKKNRTRKRR